MKKNFFSLKTYFSILIFSCFVIHLFCLSSYAETEQTETETRRRIEEETRQELKTTEAESVKKENFVFDYGGWLSSYYWAYINDDNNKEANDLLRNVTFQNLRLWFKVTMYQKHLFYLRLKDSYLTRRDVSSEYTGEGDDHDGPHLDLGYLNLSINERLRLTLGRQYITLGKGIAYNKVHDAVQLNSYCKTFVLKTFFARTKPREDNLDYSIPGYKKYGHKNFYGSELAYIKNLKLIPYLYVLFQEDHPKEEPQDSTQDYNYDSRYYGVGISSEASKAFNWWIEVIREEGKSYTDAPTVELEKKDIGAWAGILGCRYEFDLYTHPDAEFEFAYGSGDKDRTRVTNTDGGNLYGEDKNFLYYGYYFAGYTLDPRLSNIHIYRLGFSVTPFEAFKIGKDFVLGTKFYLYRKDKAKGAIYDTDANKISKDIGKEINFYIYWKINPKATWVLRYGKFFAGAAYNDATDDDSQYLYTNLTLTF